MMSARLENGPVTSVGRIFYVTIRDRRFVAIDRERGIVFALGTRCRAGHDG
jgi:hypothetical protein